jgi:hypothetical protein
MLKQEAPHSCRRRGSSVLAAAHCGGGGPEKPKCGGLAGLRLDPARLGEDRVGLGRAAGRRCHRPVLPADWEDRGRGLACLAMKAENAISRARNAGRRPSRGAVSKPGYRRCRLRAMDAVRPARWSTDRTARTRAASATGAAVDGLNVARFVSVVGVSSIPGALTRSIVRLLVGLWRIAGGTRPRRRRPGEPVTLLSGRPSAPGRRGGSRSTSPTHLSADARGPLLARPAATAWRPLRSAARARNRPLV